MYDDYNGKMREDNVSCTLTPNTGSSTERNGQKVVLPVLTSETSEDRHGAAVEISGGTETVGLNVESDGTAISLKAQYQQTSGANLVRRGTFGATGACVKIKEATKQGYAVAINTEKDGSCRTLRARHNLFAPSNLSRDDSYGVTGAGIKIMGTLDPARHSQMDVHDEGGIMSCLDNIQEKKKVGIPINREQKDPPG
jgi:hypothetical protein